MTFDLLANMPKEMPPLAHLQDAIRILYTEQNIEFRNWHYILQSFRNDIWLYPTVLFIHTRIMETKSISKQDIHDCCRFMQNMARLLYSKGFDRTLPMPTTYDETYRAIICAAQGIPYEPNIHITDSFKEKLGGAITATRFRRGFCAILEQMYQKHLIRNGKLDDAVPIKEKSAIEHIIPNHWHDEITWRDAEFNQQILNTLGNICLIEKSVHVRTSDYLWITKRKIYRTSAYKTVLELSRTIEWNPATYHIRHADCVDFLCRFFNDLPFRFFD
jgi:hypothetical protein